MKTRNIISVLHGEEVIESSGLMVDKKQRSLKKSEIRTMRSFYEIMTAEGCWIKHFDGFFVSYSIAQIGKELDLLRFGVDYILNVEIKSEIKEANKQAKILKQMRENYYYLKFLGKPILIFTYEENVGFYQYDSENDSLKITDKKTVAEKMRTQQVDYSVDPDKEFVPSNYLISPFNSTAAFVAGEYFLTSAQQRIKEEIRTELIADPFMFFCLSANAGTGKTLLMYDIAKDMMREGQRIKIVHCGKLNDGHIRLRDEYKWDIVSIRSIAGDKTIINLDNCDFVFVDESQRIRAPQLFALTSKAVEKNVPLIFSFDTKQYLRTGETRDLTQYLETSFPTVKTSTKKLTNKIRTNKAMASFITNLMNIGKSHDNLHYESVTVEYINNYAELRAYLAFLEQNGWTPITYTTSQRTPDPYDQTGSLCGRNAHDVIGQEFSKVVLVMDQNFGYDTEGKLSVNPSYYSAKGMLYQIVTRVVDELKIIVINNPILFAKLLEIKSMGE